ncbi:hypothetical protein HZS_6133 [Henneguya salminicola]|nr:hypothetical protein HZS_6133 [Henneguya salminicola]
MPVRLIVFAENIQVKGKHICDRNESAVTRIKDDNITPKIHQRCLQFNTLQSVINSRLAIKRTGSLFFQSTVDGQYPRPTPYYINMGKKRIS